MNTPMDAIRELAQEERNSEICICELCGVSFFGCPAKDSLCPKCLINKDWQEEEEMKLLTTKEWKALLKRRIKELTKHLSVINRLKKGASK